MNSTATRSNSGTAVATEPAGKTVTVAAAEPKKARKARAKPDGLVIQFRMTDAEEIAKLTDLATKDRRTPENYISLLTYHHLLGHAPIVRPTDSVGV